MRITCFLCNHPIYPKDEIKPVPICGVCKMSMNKRELSNAIERRMAQIICEKEIRKIKTGLV